jgi:carbamoyltransferase
VANGRILKEGPFENVWIQPSAGDAGGALGAALRIWYKYLGNKRTVDNISDSQKGSFLGPEYSDTCVENYLKANNIPHVKLAKEALFKTVSQHISNEKVIGWFQGRMEFGPRALGARSIIGDARSPAMQSRMNLKIKFRESFRPFAPSVLAEKAHDYFDIRLESPYMLLTANVNNGHVKKNNAKEPEGFDRLKIIRSNIPAVTHVDNSARLQTVSKDSPNSAYYGLISEFYKQTGCPVIINTSFNVRGEPIVCTPQDAYRCFMGTEMDYLVMGSFVLDKKNQPKQKIETKQCFELD